jgi:proteic killer suppression protein
MGGRILQTLAPVNKNSSSTEKIALFRSLFRGRADVYPRRFESRTGGKSGCAPACANEWVRGVWEKPRVREALTDTRYPYIVTSMILSFADATTADLWEERNSKAARRVPRDMWPIVHRKLTMLDSSLRLDDLAPVPGNRLEALAGDRKGQHSIRVNQQYRITFRWERHDAHDVCCEDYH